ncbi:Uncharacterised protein [Vibrio cholerae]|nr:Uncharacterised protein [Vibrio cholerae]CSC45017.1 Uncharacterised protein [Vibrio cholerae]
MLCTRSESVFGLRMVSNKSGENIFPHFKRLRANRRAKPHHDIARHSCRCVFNNAIDQTTPTGMYSRDLGTSTIGH